MNEVRDLTCYFGFDFQILKQILSGRLYLKLTIREIFKNGFLNSTNRTLSMLSISALKDSFIWIF